MGTEIGLCAHCRHVLYIESDRGRRFVQCGLAFEDCRYPKYPRLPVLECPGFIESGIQSTDADGEN